MKLPYFPFYPGDYLSDTNGLSCCEHGAYMLLLATSWQRGPLRDDMDYLQRLCANPPVEVLRYILETYWRLIDAGWTNDRLELEREKIISVKKKRSKAAVKANASRWQTGIANGSQTDPNRIANGSQTDRKQGHKKVVSHNHTQNHTHTHTQNQNHKKETPEEPKWAIPDGVDPTAWEEFEQHRKEIKKPLTDRARKANAKMLLSMPYSDQMHAVEASIANRWTGIFKPKVAAGSRDGDWKEKFINGESDIDVLFGNDTEKTVDGEVIS